MSTSVSRLAVWKPGIDCERVQHRSQAVTSQDVSAKKSTTCTSSLIVSFASDSCHISGLFHLATQYIVNGDWTFSGQANAFVVVPCASHLHAALRKHSLASPRERLPRYRCECEVCYAVDRCEASVRGTYGHRLTSRPKGGPTWSTDWAIHIVVEECNSYGSI